MHPLNLLSLLPKLPHTATASDLAADLRVSIKRVDKMVRQLRDEDYRVEARITKHGMSYGVSVVSWDRAQRDAEAWLERNDELERLRAEVAELKRQVTLTGD
jgi:cell division protein FtsB